MKDLYVENDEYKTLIKETEDKSKYWKDIPYFWIGRIRIVKMVIQPKQSTDSKQPLSKYPCHFSQK